jgi:putative zinc finger protein
MSIGCPPAVDLIRLADGETTHNETARLRAHLEGCASCRRQSAELGQLLADIAAPVALAPAADRAQSVLRAIEAGVPLPGKPARRRLAAWTGLAGVAAAAAAALVVLVHGAQEPDGERVVARGGAASADGEGLVARGGAASAAITRRVGVSLYAPLAGRVPVRGGARIPAPTLFTAAYRNLDREHDSYLLLFAVDARGDIHWLYPAFTDAHSDPEAVRLPFSAGETAMPDSVALEHPALGTLRVFSVLSPRAAHVSAIESLPRDQLHAADLERRLPHSHVEELAVELVDDTGGAPGR